MSRGKSPGPDEITTDWLKDLDKHNKHLLLELLNSWWDDERLPKEMSEARVASLYKKGDPNNLENYRPISLLNTLFKIIAMIIKWRIEEGIEDDLMSTQYGFRKGKSTTQAIYLARRLQEFAERAGLPGTMIFLDWEKAFDKIRHEWLLKTLESYKLPSNILNLIKSFYETPLFKVVVEGVSSPWFTQSAGIRQGCPLSPYLFLLVMNRIFEQVHNVKEQVSQMSTNTPFNYYEFANVNFSEILFADDTLIFAAQGGSLEHLLWAVEEVSQVYGLRLNRTKCASISLKGTREIMFSNGELVPQEDNAEYLGVMMNATADPVVEVNRRLAAARYVWLKLHIFWRHGLLTMRDKLLIYDALIGSKLSYGLHVLSLREGLINKLDAFYYKGLRKILKVPSTFINRHYSNTKLLELVHEKCSKQGTGGLIIIIVMVIIIWS